MIIHNSQRQPSMVRVIISRLPVYQANYGDGFGDVIQGFYFFEGMSPKAMPIVKQRGMKAIDVVRDKGISTVADVASKAFSAIKERLARLIRNRIPQPFTLPSTEVMPAYVSKVLNQAAYARLAELAGVPVPLSEAEREKTIAASLEAGSGLTRVGLRARQ